VYEATDLIARALGDMQEYQQRFDRDPAVAQVSLGGMSHALVPTHVLARELPRELMEIVGQELAPIVMYRLGFLVGRSHAAAFFEDRNISTEEAEYRVITGPFHFAWAGYGDVELLIWEPKIDCDFRVLWESDNSFSARESQKDGCRSRACQLQAGYSAGWCTESTGLPLQTYEIACRAEGVSHCRFLIAHRDRVRQQVLEPCMHLPTKSYTITHARTPDAASL
jgi:hypothetical protein